MHPKLPKPPRDRPLPPKPKPFCVCWRGSSLSTEKRLPLMAVPPLLPVPAMSILNIFGEEELAGVPRRWTMTRDRGRRQA